MKKVIFLSFMLIVTAGLLSAQVTVTPPSGNLPAGSSVTVTNNTGSTVGVFVDGTLIGVVSPGDNASYPVPTDPALIGHEFTLEVKDINFNVLVTRNYTITMPVAEETESEEASQREL